jgi:hypothetical protein
MEFAHSSQLKYKRDLHCGATRRHNCSSRTRSLYHKKDSSLSHAIYGRSGLIGLLYSSMRRKLLDSLFQTEADSDISQTKCKTQVISFISMLPPENHANCV